MTDSNQTSSERPLTAPTTPATAPASPPERRLPGWRLWAPLLCQAALVMAIPAQAVYTYLTGTTIVLQTAPVDPYDFLRGYYQILGYEISDPNTLKTLPGSPTVLEGNENYSYIDRGQPVYVILQKPEGNSESDRPPAWEPVAVRSDRPENLPDNQIAIRGEGNGWGVEYGLETYYMPESERDRVNADINFAQQTDPESFVVEVKVDSGGHAIPVRLWVRDRSFQF
ncbi:GDYXXLXY domain-containing protein [Lyngbya sp. CCY1209]|uniref:GDYXXLXY domain-containing protein n=1 Tax=Lyngbya sp. CCY1209 TaxID=2886103 RepID=UPI002D214251|nr:GDYXXLXY domain-containing protein [Lyngbya sp. CCY1209]MEB3881918.1 GDYXXLXY domain-containing protein [Lyngbya sp. CCY1209]